MTCTKCKRDIIKDDEIYQVVIQKSFAPANEDEPDYYEEYEHGWVCYNCLTKTKLGWITL
jgi:hypothetical protein